MILGRDIHPASACFDELEAVLAAETKQLVVLNAHAFPTQIPPGAVIYNLENVGTQVRADAFEGHEIWDFSAGNVERWQAAGRKATHVPIGYHASMKRFEMRPWAERDIDVVFCGCVNARRAWVLDELRAKGLKVCVIGPGESYGAARDEVLARSKLALNMLYDDDNLYPVLRAAHLVANGVPMVSENAREQPRWSQGAASVNYCDLADACMDLLAKDTDALDESARACLEALRERPMSLPDPWAAVRDWHSPDLESMYDARACLEALRERPMTLPDPWAAVRQWHSPDLESMYETARGHAVSATPLVCIVMPTYRETERVARMSRDSRNKVRTHMAENGINSVVLHLADDSLVCRMRQIACHHFLASAATHMLFWDADIAARDVDCVTQMLAAKLPVVAGACPFKDMTGRTVHNLWPETQHRIASKQPLELPNGCIEVRDAGSGFMLIERATLISLQRAHPELLHWSKREGFPLWALFDTAVVDGEYLSEDYRFCRLWQQHGGKVHVYVPARFTHYGEHGFEASFMEQYGLGVAL